MFDLEAWIKAESARMVGIEVEGEQTTTQWGMRQIVEAGLRAGYAKGQADAQSDHRAQTADCNPCYGRAPKLARAIVYSDAHHRAVDRDKWCPDLDCPCQSK